MRKIKAARARPPDAAALLPRRAPWGALRARAVRAVALCLATRAEHVDVNFDPVPPGTAYTVELEKAAAGHEKQATFFMALKAVRAKLYASSAQGRGTLRGNRGGARRGPASHQLGHGLRTKHVGIHPALRLTLRTPAPPPSD